MATTTVTATRVAAPARRGDLVLIESKSSWEREPRWTLERVTGVTRDGWVRDCEHRYLGELMGEPLWRWMTVRGNRHQSYRVGYRNHWLVSATLTDVEALWVAWCERERCEPDERHPDGRRDGPEPFRSLEEASAFAKAYRRD